LTQKHFHCRRFSRRQSGGGDGLEIAGTRNPAQGLVLLAPWLDMNLEQYDSYNRLAPDGIVYDAAFMDMPAPLMSVLKIGPTACQPDFFRIPRNGRQQLF